MEDLVPEASPENVQLKNDGVREEGKSQCGPSLAANETHEEAEPDENHDVDVLEPGVVVGKEVRVNVLDLVADEEAKHEHDEDFEEDEHHGEEYEVPSVADHLLCLLVHIILIIVTAKGQQRFKLHNSIVDI